MRKRKNVFHCLNLKISICTTGTSRIETLPLLKESLESKTLPVLQESLKSKTLQYRLQESLRAYP